MVLLYCWIGAAAVERVQYSITHTSDARIHVRRTHREEHQDGLAHQIVHRLRRAALPLPCPRSATSRGRQE